MLFKSDNFIKRETLFTSKIFITVTWNTLIAKVKNKFKFTELSSSNCILSKETKWANENWIHIMVA